MDALGDHIFLFMPQSSTEVLNPFARSRHCKCLVRASVTLPNIQLSCLRKSVTAIHQWELWHCKLRALGAGNI